MSSSSISSGGRPAASTAPSNGTTLASLVHGGAFILSAALNQTAIPVAGGVGKLLDAFREQGEGLADIRVDSPLVQRLNSLSQPSTVEYFVLAGENDPRCPIRQVDNYLDALAARKATYEVSRFDAGHGSLVVEETMRHAATEIAFARRACGLPEA